MKRAQLLVGLLLCVGGAVAAQQSATPQQPLFRARADVVNLDVSVLDKDRHPVRDLKAADFTILEDGKPQPIVAFSAVDVPEAPPSSSLAVATAWTRTIAPDVQNNDLPKDGRIFVLLFDDALIPLDPKIVQDAKKIGRDVIDHLGPGDQMAVAFSEASRAAQDFTSDRARLLAAVESLRAGRATYLWGWDLSHSQACLGPSPRSPGPCGNPVAPQPGADSDADVRAASMRTLQAVADALANEPQRRKILVWVSPGIPANPASRSPVLAHGTGNGTANRDMDARISDELPDLFRQLQRSNVTVYPIDPSGLGGLEFFIKGKLDNIAALQYPSKAAVDGGGDVPKYAVPLTGDLAHFVSKLDLDFVEAAAENTGGRAIVNTNDFAPGIDAIFRENGSYYLIGYQATDSGSGKLHRTTVKVNRPGLEVRTRSGYYATNTKDEVKAAAASPVSKAIAGVLPASGLSMQLALAPFASSSATGATVTIAVGISEPSPLARTLGAVDLETRAFTEDGYSQGTAQNQTAHLTLAGGGSDDMARYQVLSHIDLKPGRYQLRIAAHSSIDDRTGSVFTDVDIPDFANAPVSLSGVLLESTPAPTAAPKDALAAIVPVVPTATRTFDQRDRINAFVRVYQGGKAPLMPVTLAIHVVNDKGDTVSQRDDVLSATSFGTATRSADDRIAVPTASLPAGEYLLAIETTIDKTTARRDVRFTIK